MRSAAESPFEKYVLGFQESAVYANAYVVHDIWAEDLGFLLNAAHGTGYEPTQYDFSTGKESKTRWVQVVFKLVKHV